jgi:hypothetical protein
VTEGAREQSRGIGGISHRAAAWLAWSMWTLSLLFVVFSGGVLGYLGVSSQSYSDLGAQVLIRLQELTFTTVGAFVASRRPENPIGWIFCAGGLLFSVTTAASAYAEYASHARPGQLPGVEYVGWFSEWVLLPTLFLTATMLCLLFPDGRFLSAEWRFVAGVAFIGWVMTTLGGALGVEATGTLYGDNIHNPVEISDAMGEFLRTMRDFGLVLLVLSLLASITSLFARWVPARGQERQQIKWFAYAAAVMVSGVSSVFITLNSSLEFMWDLGWLVGILGFAFLPVATAIAILRYRLYDIDRIINRTLVYGSLTVMLVALYFGGIVVMQRVFILLTGQQSTLAVVASTLLIAALFTPLRRRIQGFIDRRFYRRKYDARKTLEAFSAKLRNETDLDALSEDLVGAVRETMQPAHVSLWLRPDTPRKDEQAV